MYVHSSVGQKKNNMFWSVTLKFYLDTTFARKTDSLCHFFNFDKFGGFYLYTVSGSSMKQK